MNAYAIINELAKKNAEVDQKYENFDALEARRDTYWECAQMVENMFRLDPGTAHRAFKHASHHQRETI